MTMTDKFESLNKEVADIANLFSLSDNASRVSELSESHEKGVRKPEIIPNANGEEDLFL